MNANQNVFIICPLQIYPFDAARYGYTIYSK
jgi:hypothetical protein